MPDATPPVPDTTQQERIELHTLDLLRRPEIESARYVGEKALRDSIADADLASLERLPEVAEEITLNALIGFADGYSGQDQPRLIMRAPRKVHGVAAPGNRGLHDNPDTFYRLIPLDGRSDFLLEGKVSQNPATVFELSALTSSWQTLANLTRTDLGIAPSSEFKLRFSPTPPSTSSGHDGATRHIQITPDAEMLLVRETLADWAHEKPSEIQIQNYVDRGGERAEDSAGFVVAAAARVEKWFRESIRLTELPLSQPPNRFPAPVISGEHGKLVTMAYSIGHFWVRPEEALVLTIDPGPAGYVSVPITNLWGTTNRNLDSAASLNNHQASPNPDGSFTCVLSLRDPGIANWLDPDGLERGFLFLRWANLDSSSAARSAPAVRAQLVPFNTLREALPKSSLRTNKKARLEMIQRRQEQYALRFATHL
ncbi:MAG: hypothetical protein AB8G23_12865 [Myxococcota bacterium]